MSNNPIRPATVHHLAPRLAQVQPDTMFRVDDQPDCVFAVLSAQGRDVREGDRIWCVVIARNPGTSTLGSLLPLPADTAVQPVDLVGSMQIAERR